MPLCRRPSSMPCAQRSVVTPGAMATITALKFRSAASVLAFAGEAEEVLRCARSENNRIAEKNTISANPSASFLTAVQKLDAKDECILCLAGPRLRNAGDAHPGVQGKGLSATI